jgi:hypothetical protein
LISEATNLYYTEEPLAAQTARNPSAANVAAPRNDGTFVIPRLIHGDQTPAPPRD